MAETDDYERLLREVEQYTAGSKASGGPVPAQAPKATPARAQSQEVAAKEDGGQARMAWAALAAVGGLVLGILLAILPFIGVQVALGAAVGAAAAGFISGPPRWFDRD